MSVPRQTALEAYRYEVRRLESIHEALWDRVRAGGMNALTLSEVNQLHAVSEQLTARRRKLAALEQKEAARGASRIVEKAPPVAKPKAKPKPNDKPPAKRRGVRAVWQEGESTGSRRRRSK